MANGLEDNNAPAQLGVIMVVTATWDDFRSLNLAHSGMSHQVIYELDNNGNVPKAIIPRDNLVPIIFEFSNPKPTEVQFRLAFKEARAVSKISGN